MYNIVSNKNRINNLRNAWSANSSCTNNRDAYTNHKIINYK